MRRKCPNCQSSAGIRKIIYGLPSQPLDETRYSIGGCCTGYSETSPTHRCNICQWEGLFLSSSEKYIIIE